MLVRHCTIPTLGMQERVDLEAIPGATYLIHLSQRERWDEGAIGEHQAR